MPKRIQMRRDKPWRKDNPDAVIVARPSEWGNPFRVGDDDPWHPGEKITVESAVRYYGERFTHAGIQRIKGELAGRDLACWCPLDQPCHADFLLRVANDH